MKMRKCVDVVVGLQYGDEGKARIVDYLVNKNKYDYVCRFNGGANAGHTVKIKDKEFILHLIPAGILTPDTICILGNGMVIDPILLSEEIKILEELGVERVKERILISNRAHFTFKYHYLIEESLNLVEKIGTTKRAIGPTYVDKTARIGFTYNEYKKDRKEFKKRLFNTFLDKIKVYDIKINDINEYFEANIWTKFTASLDSMGPQMFIPSHKLLHHAIYESTDISILCEGAQATRLDIDFGDYPNVSTSNASTGGVCTGLGIPPQAIRDVYGVFKPYVTKVGEGKLIGECEETEGRRLRVLGGEYGATTGRDRRIGWLDLRQLREDIKLCGVSHLVMTKIDVLKTFTEKDNCFKVGDLDFKYFGKNNFDQLIPYIEKKIDMKICIISNGKERNQLVDMLNN